MTLKLSLWKVVVSEPHCVEAWLGIHLLWNTSYERVIASTVLGFNMSDADPLISHLCRWIH